MADQLKKKIGSGVIVLVATDEAKASIIVAVTPDLTDNINAVELVKLGAEALGGSGGGGRPDMAQAGGANPAAASDALSVIEDKLG
jgi:alanyl-tRNA synthetase